MRYEKAKKALKVKIPGYGTVDVPIELKYFDNREEQLQALDGETGVFNVVTKAVHATQKSSGRAYGANFEVPEDKNTWPNWIATEVIPKIQEIVKKALPNTGTGGGLTGAEAKDKLAEIKNLDPTSASYAEDVARILNG